MTKTRKTQTTQAVKNAQATRTFRKDKFILISIFAIGIIPLFIGLFLFYNPQYLSGKTTERGELFNPPLDARPLLGASGKWQIVLLAADECLEECRQMIYFARQTHAALKEGRQQRVTRAIFIKDDVELPELVLNELERQSPPISSVIVSDSELNELFGSRFNDLNEINNNIFIVDPNGNLILRYRSITEVKQAKNLLRDINHLLRASRIG